jgi:dipeptidyl aminopeptidase/acylaminoacyl peptidase
MGVQVDWVRARRVAGGAFVAFVVWRLLVAGLDWRDAESDAQGRRPARTTRWGPRGGGRHPAIVLIHGGGGPGFFVERPDYRVYPEALAARGWIVVMPHYAEARRSPRRTISEAIDRLVAAPDVDASRIGVVGFSRGGFIGTCVAGTDARVRAFVDLYGGVDADCLSEITRMPATLVLHGGRDEMVPPRNAHLLTELVRSKGGPVQTHVYHDQEHGFVGAALADSIERMTEFFAASLSTSPAELSLP